MSMDYSIYVRAVTGLNDRHIFLACSALVCLAALLVALSGGITITIYNGSPSSASEESTSSGSGDISSPLSSSGEEQFFTSSSESFSSSDPIFDPTLPYDAFYSQPGEFGLEQELNTVTLSTDGVVLKNKTIHRSVLITADSGLVTLENCTVEGSIKVSGGADVLLSGVTAERIEVNSAKNVTVTSAHGSSAAVCDVYTDCGLSGTGFEKVRTQYGAGLVTIKLALMDMELPELTVVESVTVHLENASIESVTGSDNIYYE